MDKEKKISDAQIKAQKKYDEENRERRNYVKQRSTARTFIRKSNKEDLLELKNMIKIKLKEFE